MRVTPKREPSGSALIVTVVTTGILGIMLAAFVKLAEFQNHITARSHAWNAALPLAEAGVEEALTHLYHVDRGDLATNGWIRFGASWTRTRTNKNLRIAMVISNAAQPVVYSRGGSRIVGRDHAFVERTVRVRTRREALFSKAIVAKEDITLNGNNILVDSFDSLDPAYSSGGLYDSAKRKNNGDIATNSSVRNALDTDNANICGRVSTGPGGSVEIGPKGKGGKVLYRNTFITDLEITEQNVAAIVASGRSRWKIENENNNTLKTKGYNLEHNFGHGKKHLSSLLATMNLLAFAMHGLLDHCDAHYRLIRRTLVTRQTFFDDIRALTRYHRFASWIAMMDFMMKGLEIGPYESQG